MNLRALDTFLERAFACTLQASLAASILALVVLLVSLVFRKVLPPRWRYTFWLLVMLRLLVPVTPSSSLSVFNLGNHAFPQKADLVPAQIPEGPLFLSDLLTGHEPAEAPLTPTLSPSDGERVPARAGEGRLMERPPSRPGSQPEASAHATVAWVPSPAPVGAATPGKLNLFPFFRSVVRYLWLGGAAGYLLLVVVQHRRLSNWVKRQLALDTPRLKALLKEAQASLGVSGDIPVIRTECPGSPAVFGLRRPRLLLPGTVIASLDDQELRLVILHELVHVRRRDVLLNWAAIVAQSLHWFNPVVWLALKRWRGERELVCDAEVMARLAPPERRVYGATLLKLASTFAEPPFAHSLTPIIEHKHEIERRITMISKYKPMPRFAALALALSLAVLGALTFTRAAEKSPAAKPARQPENEVVADQQEEAGRRLAAYLEKELVRLDPLISNKQVRLSALKQGLRITDAEAAGANLLELETLRRLEVSRIEAESRCKQLETMYLQWTAMNRSELKQAVVVAYPDAQLGALLANKNSAEQNLAQMSTSFAPGNLEVLRVSNVLHTIEKQIEDRLQGLLQGLKAKLAAERAAAEALQKAIAEAKDADIRRGIERRPYFEAKRELENLTALRDRLQLRLVEQKITAGVPLTF